MYQVMLKLIKIAGKLYGDADFNFLQNLSNNPLTLQDITLDLS